MSSTTATNTYLKPDYLQFSSSSTSYDSSQSPLALLAQTCSSIGKDSPSPPSSSSLTTAPPIITSLVTKSSSILSSTSNSDKSLLSSKRSSPSQTNSTIANRKSTHPVKPTILTPSSSFVESNPLSAHLPALFDPTTTAAALLLRSSLAYLAAQQQQQQQHHHHSHSFSTPCTVPGCLQCETVRHILAASLQNQPYNCHWYSCNARFSSADELVEHLRHSHASTTTTPATTTIGKSNALLSYSNHHRFHPYLKPPSLMLNNNDQLPFFYPHLSLSPMTGTTRRSNNNTNNNN